jgi:hypothetical protein
MFAYGVVEVKESVPDLGDPVPATTFFNISADLGCSNSCLLRAAPGNG